jgi:hypothetical protein
MEPQSKSMGEEVRFTKSKVGVEPHVVVQNEGTKVVAKHPKKFDVIQ